jgi:putative ABC transport system ATP-binding protein
VIVVDSISKTFGHRTLWRNVSFSVNAGEMLALVGPSGCGKSTLLNCVGLLDRVDSGEITIEGRNVANLRAGTQRRIRRDSLGYLFQNYALIDNASIDFNLRVAIGAKRGESRKDGILEGALKDVGLEGRGEEKVFQLSGGEQQRVALARLLVKKPTVILADEPTGALDDYNTDRVISTLRNMAESGCAILIATHSKRVEDSCDSTLAINGVGVTRSVGSD